jgi:hypothetical protein
VLITKEPVGDHDPAASASARRESQLRREQDAVDAATTRFRERLRKKNQLLNTSPATKMVAEYWEELAQMIAEEQGRFSTAGVHEKKHTVPLLAISAESLAVLTLHAIIESQRWPVTDDVEDAEDEDAEAGLRGPGPGLPDVDSDSASVADCGPTAGEDEDAFVGDEEGPSLVAVARRLGARCNYHWNIAPPEHRDEGLERCLAKYLPRRRGRETSRISSILAAPWRESNRDILLGAELLAFAEQCKIVRIGRGRAAGGGQVGNIVVMTKDFQEAFVKVAAKGEELAQPFRRPMIVTPLQWTDTTPGGYLSADVSPDLTLIKPNVAAGSTSGVRKQDLMLPLDALNALQESRWRINTSIYETMRAVRDQYAARKLPDLKESQISRLGLAKIGKGKTFRCSIDVKCDACADITGEPEIFFPYHVDYRGRIYAIPNEVNPQVDDVGRALLIFAEGRQLDAVGAHWLAVHVANMWGRDVTVTPKEAHIGKLAYDRRVTWVKARAKEISASASAPLSHRWWMNADQPWRFLAACQEWSRYQAEPGCFTTHLPVTVDGTCNGLQHIAALRRDKQLARQTNVAPTEPPNDIYETVAAELRKVLKKDSEANPPVIEAVAWLKHVKIDRDVCKAAVMTTPYGVTRRGMVRQLFGADFSRPLHLPGDGRFLESHIPYYERLEYRVKAGQDEVSKLLWNRLSVAGRAIIESPRATPQERRHEFVKELNFIREGPCIYTPELFPELSEEARELLATELKGEDISRLNKVLIQHEFRRDIRQTDSHRWKCCCYLARKLEECIGTIVDPNGELTTWLKAAAAARAKRNAGLVWVSPSGFPVAQCAQRMKKHTVRAEKRAMIIYEPAKPFKIDSQRQTRLIIPNFIHSLDAAHLVRTICRLKREGVHDFGTIHDGFSVHATDVEHLQLALREEFAQMYSSDLLQDLYSQQGAASGLAEPPPPGDLDINDVRRSQYFFC